jgi:hypothetical protein
LLVVVVVFRATTTARLSQEHSLSFFINESEQLQSLSVYHTSRNFLQQLQLSSNSCFWKLSSPFRLFFFFLLLLFTFFFLLHPPKSTNTNKTQLCTSHLQHSILYSFSILLLLPSHLLFFPYCDRHQFDNNNYDDDYNRRRDCRWRRCRWRYRYRCDT